MRFTQLSSIPRSFPWTTYPHFHDREYEVVFVVSGKGLLQLPGVSRPLEQGCIALIPPNIAHYYQPEENCSLSHFAVRFTPLDNGSPLAQSLQYSQPVLARARDIERLHMLLDLAQALAQESGDTIDQKVQTACLLFLELVQEDFSREGTVIPTYTPEYANEVLIYLQHHISSRVTLEEISRQFSLSQSHLSRVFLRTYHISPINYLIYSRMRQARIYILTEDLTPAQIARRLAYKTTYQFSKAFEQFFGCRPEEFRAFEQKIMAGEKL